MKIIEKPHPIGNKFNTMCNAKLQIVLYAKLYKEKDITKTEDTWMKQEQPQHAALG